MLHTESDIKQLNERALRITSAAVLPQFSHSSATVIEHTVREPCGSHVLAPSQERPDLVVEDGRSALFVHPLEDLGQLCEALGDLDEELGDTSLVVQVDGLDGVEDQRNDLCTACFNGNGNDEKPPLVVRPREGIQNRQVVWLSEVLLARTHRGKIPQVERGVRRTRR